MPEQTTEGEILGIEVELTTRGPEAQDGHQLGSDVLHSIISERIEIIGTIQEELDSVDINAQEIVTELEDADE